MRIKAESRQEVGKKVSKRLRKEGRMPAIIYGENKESIPISLAIDDLKSILKAEKGENTVLKIQRDDIEVDAMLKEVQYNYLSDQVIHADFLRIDPNKPILASVPIVASGEPIGVKLEGGIFDFITREVQVKCLASKIPQRFKIDISQLHSGHSIKAEDLEMDEDIKLITDSHRVICAISAKSKATEEGVDKAGEAPEAATSETETKKEESSE